jgi:hypothetical protein
MKINREVYPVSSWLREDNFLFPREQHPDTRTAKEFFRDLEDKLFIKRYEEKAKREYLKGSIMCIQNGRIFNSAREAEEALGITRGGVSHQLKGRVKMCLRKYSFVYV